MTIKTTKVKVKMLSSTTGVDDGEIYPKAFPKEEVFYIGPDLARSFSEQGVCKILETVEDDGSEATSGEGDDGGKAGGDAPKDLKKMNLDELRARATELGIEFDESAKKKDLIEAIEATSGE